MVRGHRRGEHTCAAGHRSVPSSSVSRRSLAGLSRPSIKSWLSGGRSFAKLPGRNSAKMPSKSPATENQICIRGSCRARTLTRSIFPMYFSRRPSRTGPAPRSSARPFPYLSTPSVSIFFRLDSRFSTLVDGSSRWVYGQTKDSSTHVSIMFVTFGFTFFFVPRCRSSSSRASMKSNTLSQTRSWQDTSGP